MNKNISVVKLTMDFNPVHLDDTADWWHIKIETNKKYNLNDKNHVNNTDNHNNTRGSS